MPTKVTDPRIGVVDDKDIVIKQPTHYATGVFWNRGSNPAPTTSYFGENFRYFYVLPIGRPAAAPEVRAELEELVKVDSQSAPKAAPVAPVVIKADDDELKSKK